MLKPRWRKVLTDFWDDKIRTLLVIASIAVGVFAVGVIAGAYVILSEDMQSSYVGANPANIRIVTDTFDNELVKTIERMEGIADVDGRREATVRVQVAGDDWSNIDVIAVQDFSNIKVNKISHSDGSNYLEDHQIVLEDNKKLDSLNAALGDILVIELTDGSRRKLSFVGTVKDETKGTGNLVGNVTGYVNPDTMEWLHQDADFNQLFITVSEKPNDKEHIQMMADRISDQIEKSSRHVYRVETALRNQHPMASIIQALLGILLVLGILVVFLSGSLIANTISALLNQHLRQIGVMKLVGARKKQIIQMYLVLIVVFSLCALLIAVPLGSLGAYALSDYAASFIGFTLKRFRIIPIATIIQVIIAILVPPLAGLFPVLSGARVTVQKAITSSGIQADKEKKSLIDRILESLRGLSRPLLISLRNTFRRKGRLVLTLFTLTLGGAIFISVFNVQVSLNEKIDRTTRYFRSDVNLDLDRQYRIEAVNRLAGTVPGVQRVEGWAVSSAEILRSDGSVADNVTVFAPPVDSKMVEPILLQGRWLVPGDEYAITVNESFWDDYPELAVGDMLRLKIYGKEADWQIVGIFQFTGVDDLFAYSTYDHLSKVLEAPGSASAFRILTADHTTGYQTEMSSQIDELFKNAGYHVKKVEPGNSVIERAMEYIGVLTNVLLIMALLTALVGSIGLAGTLSMNVLERTREIGVMRAIGAYNTIVSKLVIIEGLLIGIISYIFSIILSFPITSLLADIVSRAIFNSPADFAFTLQGFIIWLLVVVVLSVIASVMPARNASQMTIREVLAYE